MKVEKQYAWIFIKCVDDIWFKFISTTWCNLAGAIGKAGAPALSKFQAAREAERLDKRKTEREMRRDGETELLI